MSDLPVPPAFPGPSSGLTDEQRRDVALTRMRWAASRAHADCVAGLAQADLRLEAFVQACVDLSGLSVREERALAANESPPPAWVVLGARSVPVSA